MSVARSIHRSLHSVLLVGVAVALSHIARAETYFTLMPKIQTVAWGGSATFSTNATGAPSISYQWKKNGLVIDGATAKSYTVSNVQLEDQGGYSVTIDDGSSTFDSTVAPLVIADEVGWRWATRVGGVEDDSALGIGFGVNGIWVSGEYNGQYVRRYSPTLGTKLSDYQLTTTGDGAAGLALDGAGHLLIGANLEVASPYSRPGLLQLRDVDGGGLLWSRALGTEKGGSTTPNGFGDAVAVAPDGNGNIVVAGFYQGRGKFGAIAGGTIGNEGYCGYVAKYDSDGVALWLRDVKSDGDADDCNIRDMVVDGFGDIYVAGVLGINGRIQKTSTTSDRTVSLQNTYRRPFVAKYSTAGTLAWSYSPDDAGEYMSLCVDTAGNIWATGYVGSRTDITSRDGLLAKLSRSSGAVIASEVVNDVTGCAVRAAGTSVVWLALDATGNSKINGVRWGTTGYRCCLMEGLTLSTESITWEVPAFGGVGRRSDEADLVVAPDGSVAVVLNFSLTDAGQTVEFPKRASFPLAGRGRDGIIAAIGELPLVTTDPKSKLVAAGTEVVMEIAIGGLQNSSIQWYKGTTKLVDEIYTDVTYSKVTLADAGAHFARVSKGGSFVDSDTAELGVVNTTLPNVSVAHHKKVALTCSAAGNDLTYTWLKGGQPINGDTRVTGVNTKTLVINDTVPPDAGAYCCRVTGPGGTLTTKDSLVTVVLPPTASDFNFPPTITSGDFDFTPPVLNAATKFVITGLPPGLTYDPKTGKITGSPTVPKSYTIKIVASNAAGTATRTKILTVQKLPTSVTGKHIGMVNVGPLTNELFNAGGRWGVTVASSGNVTGALYLAGVRYALTSKVQINNQPPYEPKIVGSWTRAGDAGTLDIAIDLADDHKSTGTVNDSEFGSVGLAGWHQIAAPVGRQGSYNFAILLPPAVAVDSPEGTGFGSFKIGSTGDLTAAGMLADNTPFSTGGFVGPSGEVLVYQALYTGAKGSVVGVMRITEDVATTYANNSLSGTASWTRVPVAGSRFFPASFSVTTALQGGKYNKPASIVMGLPAKVNNALLKASGGGLAGSSAMPFSITAKNVTVLPTANPLLDYSHTACKVDPLTGAFSGSFTVSGPDPYLPGALLKRPARYFGRICLTPEGTRRGFGFFILDQVPSATTNPPTTIKTSPQRSGSVLLGPPTP